MGIHLYIYPYTRLLTATKFVGTLSRVYSSTAHVISFGLTVLVVPAVREVLTLLVSFVTGIFQRKAHGTVVPSTILPVGDDLSRRCTMSNCSKGKKELRVTLRSIGFELFQFLEQFYSSTGFE